MPKDSIYLRNSLILSRNRNKNFKALKDRIIQRIEGWNPSLLSKAGKATLVTSVIQAIPSYTMSTFQLSNGLCKELDSMVQRFW